jgi:cupin fold WbuC family metalloprotein
MSFYSLYSKVNPDQLLHSIANVKELDQSRTDISPPDKFLQVSIIKLPNGKQIPPHIHDPRICTKIEKTITQESWVVMHGKIRVKLFDLDGTFLDEKELLTGFILVTYFGGHSLECLEENSVILEYKNGPYLGRDFQNIPNP